MKDQFTRIKLYGTISVGDIGIEDVLVRLRIRICGSNPLTYGSGSDPDLQHWYNYLTLLVLIYFIKSEFACLWNGYLP
jgi:hypothetical protein